MQPITHASQKNCWSTAVTVKLCHSTVNNMHVASEATGSEIKGREREKEKEVLVASLLASLLAGLCEDSRRASWPGRQDCGCREASLRPQISLSRDGRLIIGDAALGFGGAELSSVGNCSPTGVFWTSLLGSAFLAVIVSWLLTSGILCVDSPGPVILWLSSSCCWRCSTLLLWCWALGWGQLRFPPSFWGLAYTPGKFSFLQCGASFAIIVSWQSSIWESLEWQCCVAWNNRVAWSLGWRSCRSEHSSAPFLLWTLFLLWLLLYFL